MANDKVVVVDEFVSSHDRILVSRLKTIDSWGIITNPRWDASSRAMSSILFNGANDYVEKRNCGVIQRMIRVSDATKYGVYNLDSKWVLRLEEN